MAVEAEDGLVIARPRNFGAEHPGLAARADVA
ncbi:hypothetical protein SAMN07250955_11951 [Arboricoccus pini]|uniref:Uncharacterized protein n=1 Tax=Arboricoccus pini TaxID=1963835 RepID=A0A212S1F7_9PROT|nr:hypothetical protein SAMN07250955_11951 [Arboricoccus pini]